MRLHIFGNTSPAYIIYSNQVVMRIMVLFTSFTDASCLFYLTSLSSEVWSIHPKINISKQNLSDVAKQVTIKSATGLH